MGGCNRAGRWLVRDDTPKHADAMVLLMGNIPDRILQAADLYKSGVVTRLIIVKESMGDYRALQEKGVTIIDNATQVRDAAITLGIPPDSIVILPGDARSTLQEARMVREYLTSEQTYTLLLVSSSFHMRRAGMIFTTALRHHDMPVTVLCSPSSYTSFRAEGWWKRKEDIQTVISEYVKIGSFIFIERWKLSS